MTGSVQREVAPVSQPLVHQSRRSCKLTRKQSIVGTVSAVVLFILIMIVVEWPRPNLNGGFDSTICNSNFMIPNASILNMSVKGMALDDVTFGECPEKVLTKWPNTEQPIQIVRMFKPCKPGVNCDDKNRQASWKSLTKFAMANNVKFLMGYDITDPCNSAADDQQWSWILDFLKMIGKERIIAISFGNELDIADTKHCSADFWEQGYLNSIKLRVADLEKHGFGDVMLSAVFTLTVLDNSGKSRWVWSFLKKAFQTFGKSRWVWSFNVYPFWTSGPCSSYDINATARFGEMIGDMGILRERIMNLTGNADDKLFMTETGWSSSAARDDGDLCPGLHYSSLANQEDYYRSFLSWDLSLPKALKPPDLAIFFTMRDTHPEHFGLVPSCDDVNCKLQIKNGTGFMAIRD